MTTISSTAAAIAGSSTSASATFVNGPIATTVNSPGSARTRSTISVAARRPRPGPVPEPVPVRPSPPTKGAAAPRTTSMSARPTRSRSSRDNRVAVSTSVLPATVVTRSTWMSGSATASARARPSSMFDPGAPIARSVSSRIRRRLTGSVTGPCVRLLGESARRRALGVVVVAGLHPAHELAQFTAGGLDRVLLALLAKPVELDSAGVLIGDEARGPRPVLNLAKDLLHPLLHRLVDDLRAGRVVAVCGSVRHRPALLGDSALVHEVDDQLQLVQALEVGDLGLVAGLRERLESGLHQPRHAPAQDGLLAEQVGLGFLGEGGLDAPRTQATDALGVRERERPGVAGGVLLDRDEHRHAAPVGELATHQVTRPLGRDHAHVDAGRRLHVAEPDVEPVSEEQRVAVDEVRLHRLGVQVALHVVRREDHDQVGLLARLERRDHAQALRLGLGATLRALGQADPHVDAGVAQAQRVCVSLAAVAQHGHVAALDDRQVGVVVVEQFSHVGLLLLWLQRGLGYAVRSRGRNARSVIEREPRPTATTPDWTSSRMPNGSSTRSSASSFSADPVASMVTASAATSTTFARNSWTVSRMCDRDSRSALTLSSSSSRCTACPGPSSTILMTMINSFSCLVTCSRGWSSTSTTTVIRETDGCSVGPTARESMLNPRRAKSAAIRARMPGLFSTRIDSVCLLIAMSLLTVPVRRHATGDLDVVVAGAGRHHRPHHRVAVYPEVDDDRAVVHGHRLVDRRIDVCRGVTAQADAAIRLGQLGKVRDAPAVEIGVGVARVVEQGLPLADHAQARVVDDGDLDRDPLDRAGGQLLVRHLETAVAIDGPDGC